jgi:hypothetical protein
LGEDLEDRRRLSMAANGKQDPIFAPFHGRTIGAPPRLVHAMGPWQGPRHVSGPVPRRPLQALIIAGLAAASVVAQWAYLMELRGTGPLETVVQMARFFTILTMVLVVIAFLTVAISKTRGLSAPTLAALTLSVVMTGAVYHVLLAEFWNPTGLGIARGLGPAHGRARWPSFCGGCSTRPRRR